MFRLHVDIKSSYCRRLHVNLIRKLILFYFYVFFSSLNAIYHSCALIEMSIMIVHSDELKWKWWKLTNLFSRLNQFLSIIHHQSYSQNNSCFVFYFPWTLMQTQKLTCYALSLFTFSCCVAGSRSISISYLYRNRDTPKCENSFRIDVDVNERTNEKPLLCKHICGRFTFTKNVFLCLFFFL